MKQIVTRTQKKGRPKKLSEAQIDMMVNHYNNGDTQKQLAEEFGVSVATVKAYLQERSPKRHE